MKAMIYYSSNTLEIMKKRNVINWTARVFFLLSFLAASAPWVLALEDDAHIYLTVALLLLMVYSLLKATLETCNAANNE
jgi:hypothetical protein